MSTRKVVHVNDLPTRLPLTTTAVVGLLLDRFDAAGWVWGMVGTIVVLIWIFTLTRLWTERQIQLKELD